MAISNTQKSPLTVGFLTVVSVDEVGWIGGYLLLNLQGRPLEFCCSAPVMPDRAQQILYGPTLRSFLLGEHIAPAILKQTKLRPTITVTDVDEVLAARSHVDLPLVQLIITDADFSQAPDRTTAMSTQVNSRTVDLTNQREGDAPAELNAASMSCTFAARQEPRLPENFRPSNKTIVDSPSWFMLDEFQIRCHDDFFGDREVIQKVWQQAHSQFGLAEPFQRIRDAVREAQRGAAA